MTERLHQLREQTLKNVCGKDNTGYHVGYDSIYLHACDHITEVEGYEEKRKSHRYTGEQNREAATRDLHAPWRSETHKLFTEVVYKTGNQVHKWMICSAKCQPVYYKQMRIAMLEDQFLQQLEAVRATKLLIDKIEQGEQCVKAIKLIVDKLERDNVERAMQAMEKDISDDKKEPSKPAGL